MTKYVIQSGGLKRYPDKARFYFKELFKGVVNNPKVLWCYFASSKDDFQSQHETYFPMFASFFPEDVKVDSVLASLEGFESQVKEADIVYFHGGSNVIFYDHVKDLDLENLLEDKVVATNSASTLVLAQHGWTCDERRCMDGLGIWPAKVGVHFYSNYGADDPRGPIDWEAAKAELEAYGDTSLPVYPLKEGEFVVFEK
jgi:hypothetical protein